MQQYKIHIKHSVMKTVLLATQRLLLGLCLQKSQDFENNYCCFRPQAVMSDKANSSGCYFVLLESGHR